MRWVWSIVAVIVILVGIVWILQGINVLPGSFMTGNILYAFLGAVLDIVGIGILVYTNRRSKAVVGEDHTKIDQ